MYPVESPRMFSGDFSIPFSFILKLLPAIPSLLKKIELAFYFCKENTFIRTVKYSRSFNSACLDFKL